MSTETHEKAFWEEKNVSFKTAAPEDDLLHRQFKDVNRSPTLTETQFFGFSVQRRTSTRSRIYGTTRTWALSPAVPGSGKALNNTRSNPNCLTGPPS